MRYYLSNMKTFLLVIILLVVFTGIIWFSRNRGEEGAINSPQLTPTPSLSEVNETLSPSPIQPQISSIPVQQASPTPTPTPKATTTPKTLTINMTESGFTPGEITIKAGDTVIFRNQGNRLHWPASAIHPTHELYPGSSISKCGTSEADSIFDACRGLQLGQSFSFTFNIKGTWLYHDHLNSSLKGTIIVQ